MPRQDRPAFERQHVTCGCGRISRVCNACCPAPWAGIEERIDVLHVCPPAPARSER
jgi:hypothetical protein